MTTTVIKRITTRDARFPLKPGEGVDAIHNDCVYSYAVTELHTESGLTGIGLAFTLGGGNDLVCRAIEALAADLVGKEIQELMVDFGKVSQKMADHPQFRWLGPHKGMVHLALASITNACFDLWAKSLGVPLWKLLIDLSPEQTINLMDLSFVEDVMNRQEALELIQREQAGRGGRLSVLTEYYPGYDTSVGWFNYSDEQIRDNCKRALDAGFTSMKLKVGAKDPNHDIRRALLVRDVAGDDSKVMVDANQQWSLPQAISICQALSAMNPYWVEEPTHPDDISAHRTLADVAAPIKIALGEHVPNRVLFKNFLQSGAVSFIQVDAVRVAGISEFLTVSLMSRKFGIPVVPHVGDMGQIHQHLVLFNHIAFGHPVVFLEYIPHLREYFRHPAIVAEGLYQTPQVPGSNSDLI